MIALQGDQKPGKSFIDRNAKQAMIALQGDQKPGKLLIDIVR